MMKRCLKRVLLPALAGAVLMPLAWAQGNSAALTPPPTAPDPCRTEVLKFEQTIAFVRQSQGNQAGKELKEKLLPAAVESDLLFKEGYCGLARYIREKKLNR